MISKKAAKSELRKCLRHAYLQNSTPTFTTHITVKASLTARFKDGDANALEVIIHDPNGELPFLADSLLVIMGDGVFGKDPVRISFTKTGKDYVVDTRLDVMGQRGLYNETHLSLYIFGDKNN